MSGTVLRTRHRDSPRTRRAARAAGVDLAVVRPTGPHGRATVADVTAAAGTAAAVTAVVGTEATDTAVVGTAAVGTAAAGTAAVGTVAAPSGSLLEVDVTALLRRAGAAARTHVLAETVAALARAASVSRPAGLPEGPVAVRVLDDDARTTVVDGADLLSVSGVVSRLTAAPAPAGDTAAGPEPVLDVVGTAGTGTTVEVRPLRPGTLVTLTVGPPARRPVVVLGPDGEEQIGIRSLLWLALTGTDPTTTAALLARVGQDLSRPAGVR